MVFVRTNTANFARTTLSTPLGATDLTASVESTANFPASPCLLVLEPDSPDRREVVLFDGTFTGTTFVASALGKRFLAGSAAESGLTHPAGSVVLCAPLSQHIDEVFTALQDTLDDVDTTVAGKAATADVVLKAGSTMTGNLVVPGIAFGVVALATTGTVNLDMDVQDFQTQAALTGNVTYTTSNRAAGRSVSVRIVNGATERSVSFPAGWVFVSPKPSVLAANKTAVLSITAFGTADTDVVAAWAVQS